jgi:hypothetical protein
MHMLKSLTSRFIKSLNRRGAGVERLADRPRRSRVWAEALENRAMLAAVSWDGGGDGLNWTSAKNWSGDVVPGASDDITISTGSSVVVSSAMNINGSLTLSNGSRLGFTGGSQSLSGSGSVWLDDTSEIVLGWYGVASTLTLGAGLTVQGSGALSYKGGASGSTIINNGTLWANATTSSLDVYTTVTNNGTIKVSGGATFNSSVKVTNNGTIEVVGSTLSTVEITNGATGAINTSGGASIKNSGTIKGGTISNTGVSAVAFNSSCTLDGVTISGDASVTGGNYLFFKNGLTLNGTLTFNSGSSPFFWGGDQALSGTGAITLTGNAYLGYSDAATNVTVASGITIDGWGGFYSHSHSGNKLINNGTIHANAAGETLSFDGGTAVTNNGVMKATGTSTLNLGGPVTNAFGGVMKATGTATLYLAGPVTNDSEITGADSATVQSSDTVTQGTKGGIAMSDSAVLNAGGSIIGGTISNGSKSPVNFTGSGTLDGVTISGGASVTSGHSLFIKNGLTLNGTLTFNDSSSLFFWGGDQALSGIGTITLAGNTYLGYSDAATNLTVGSGITINGRSGFSAYSYSGNKVINNGTIHANVAGKTLSFDSGTTLTNNGVMKATGTSTLYFGGPVTNESEISGADSATVQIVDTVTNGTKGGIMMSDSAVLNAGGSIIGGTISNGSKSAVNFTGNATLDGVTISGDASVAGGYYLFIKNGLTLNGTLTLNAPSYLFFWGGDQALSGIGTITLAGYGYLGYSDAATNLTVGSGITINGSSPFYSHSYSGNKVINNGTIHANVAGQTLSFDSGTTVTNNGVMKATNGGLLSVNSTATNNGILEHLTGGVFTIQGVNVPTTEMGISTALTQTGKTVTFTASVSPFLGVATGNVSFYDGETLLGSATLITGIATFSTSSLAAGTHHVTAVYEGDETYINNRSRGSLVTVVNVIAVTGTETISSPRTSAVGSWDVTFNELIDVTSFNWQSVTLSRNSGANLITAGTGVTIALVSGKTYRISGLSSLTTSAGSYTLSLVAGGVKDMNGFATTAASSRTWTTNLPTFSSMSSFPSPRATPVVTVGIRLSEVANLATFTVADLTLTLNGGANLATGGSGITITQNPGDLTLYTISMPASLVWAVGNYSLTVTGAGIQNASSVVFAGTRSTTWTIIAAVPGAPVLDAASEGKVGSGFTQYTTPTVKGTGSAGSTVQIYEGAVLKGSGVVAADGKYSIVLSTMSAGVHLLKARATDSFGTVTGYSAESSITVETATPTIVSMSVYSAPRTVPVGSTGIRFSSQLDLSTFTAADIFLTRDGVPVSTAGMTVVVSPTDPKLYTIVIPPASNTPDGVYVLQVVGAGIKNLAGKTVGNSFSTTWTVLPQIMNISQYAAPRTAPVTVPGIRFSNPITLSSFTWADITLKRNGGANLATSAITITQSATDPAVYTILIPSALTNTAGTYVLTVNGAGIQTPGGYTVSNSISTTWVKL